MIAFAISRTGAGKSLIYQMAAMAKPKACVLVMCPLLVRYERLELHLFGWRDLQSQCGSARNMRTSAVALSRSQMVADRSLIREASRGRYQMVFASPELVDHSTANFKVLFGLERKLSLFVSSLAAVVIDEAHFVSIW